MLPGINGTAKFLEPLSKQLKTNVVGLQYRMEYKHETISEMATALLNVCIM